MCISSLVCWFIYYFFLTCPINTCSHQGSEAANVTGPGGVSVKGSRYAPNKRRFRRRLTPRSPRPDDQLKQADGQASIADGEVSGENEGIRSQIRRRRPRRTRPQSQDVRWNRYDESIINHFLNYAAVHTALFQGEVGDEQNESGQTQRQPQRRFWRPYRRWSAWINRALPCTSVYCAKRSRQHIPLWVSQAFSSSPADRPGRRRPAERLGGTARWGEADRRHKGPPGQWGHGRGPETAAHCETPEAKEFWVLHLKSESRWVFVPNMANQCRTSGPLISHTQNDTEKSSSDPGTPPQTATTKTPQPSPKMSPKTPKSAEVKCRTIDPPQFGPFWSPLRACSTLSPTGGGGAHRNPSAGWVTSARGRPCSPWQEVRRGLHQVSSVVLHIQCHISHETVGEVLYWCRVFCFFFLMDK